MNLPVPFYANFFTLGALIPTCFFLFCAVYFLTIKKKSRATYCYGMGTLFVCGFNLAYFLASGIYHPAAALHRWLTVGIILMSELYFIKFIYFIDREEAPRPVRVLFAVLSVVAVAVPAAFIVLTCDAPRVFRFDGHYYDLDADDISRLIGYFIQLYMAIFIIATAIKMFTAEKGRRLTIFALGAAFVLASLVPSIINVMSRDGRIDRETFQVAWDVLNISGFFLMTIVFINYTADRISFMAKVIGISLTALLVLFQGIVFLSISDREKAFDGIMYGRSRLAVTSASSIPDISYLASMPADDETGKLSSISSREIDTAAYAPYRRQLMNMGILERIRELPDEGFDRGLREILGKAPSYFDGYARALVDLRRGQSRSLTGIGGRLVDEAAGLRNVLRYHEGKIRKIPDKGFRTGLRAFLSGAGGAFLPFARALDQFLSKTSLEDGALKQEALAFLAPPVLSGGRSFRAIGGRAYVAFLHYESSAKTAHEAGFPYLAYREYFHAFCMKFIYLLCATYVIIFICFSLYFRGSMVKPIERLLKGLDSIKNGDLDIRIPAKAQDEIGMLTEDFNLMAQFMKGDREKLDEYMKTLEERVRERTLELEEKNDTLRAAYEAQRVSEERYRNIVQNATDGIFKNDAMGNFIFVNPVGQELLGYPENELLKMNYRDLVTADHRDRVLGHYRAQLGDKTNESYLEFPVVRKNGQVVWLGQRVRLERSGAAWEFHGISRDITARVKAEQELKVAKEAAERANRAKSRFLANMSHELRTPLNSINGIVELLRFGSYEKNEEIVIDLEKAVEELREHVPGERAAELAESLSSIMNFLQDDGNLKRYYFLKTAGMVEGLENAGAVEALLNDIMGKVDEEDRDIFNAYRRIKESGDYLLSLIDTILNLSKIESGKIDIKKTEVDVRGMIESVIDNAKSFAKSKGKGDIAISYLVHEQVPQKAVMDHLKTKQVLLNFFSNAIKFTDEGSVTLLVNRADDAIKFTVIDTGAGIRKEEQDKVFHEFERTSSSRNVEGTGLGLAITKRLVELQDGVVGFESEYNGGSRFWFTLPLRSE